MSKMSRFVTAAPIDSDAFGLLQRIDAEELRHSDELFLP
jgi:hypothetical protein